MYEKRAARLIFRHAPGCKITLTPDMKTRPLTFAAVCLLAACASAQQEIDAAYTAKIRQYTTEPFFLTELVDHLPASATAPTPEKVLGYVVGAPEKLTYSKDIYAYMRALEKASPRVKVFSIGQTEEGREMLLVAISDAPNLARLDQLRRNTARLADPRKISENEAEALAASTIPFYWVTGSIHSPETGSPEMLMEMAYRLAVGETPLLQSIRKNTVVLITPLVEVDGHDRQVDLYRWRKANPNRVPPPLVYWGKYVAHDNNRDGMALSLALSRNLLRTFFQWHPQVLHDLHESIPFLYISTGTGPYNAWLDPIVINEWQRLAYYEVEEMTKRGVPGVWTHGFYDGWAANYMFYIANGHNAIGRFYETYGGRGADTLDRTVPPSFTTRAWFRPNPPLPKVRWSLRNNINLQQSALLLGIEHFGREKALFLRNFYLKGKRSVAKASQEGPAAWVIPADDPRPAECARLVNLLQLHGVEVHKLEADAKIENKQFPAASYVIRMDQPYSRMADMLLDRQFYNTSDSRPYDDTGWSLGPLRNVNTIRVVSGEILKQPMRLLDAPVTAPGGVRGQGKGGFVVNHNADAALATLRFRLKDVAMEAAEEPFEAAGRKFNRGSFLIAPGSGIREKLDSAGRELGIEIWAVEELPKVSRHVVAVPRIALIHSWLNTQAEGWVRLALETSGIPYTYLSDHFLRDTPNIREKFDVILFGPTPGSAQRIVNGLPVRGAPVPWRASELTPNIGTSPDQSDDIRGGMGLQGLLNVQEFVQSGGLFITIGANASIPISYGLIEDVSIETTRDLNVRGSVLGAVVADPKSPITYGYDEKLALYFNQAPVFQVSLAGGIGRRPAEPSGQRPTGRGTVTDPDVPQGRPYVPAPPAPKLKPGEDPPMDPEMAEYARPYLAPPAERPRVVVRFSEEKDLLISGLLAGGRELANRPAVIDVPKGKGHYLLFANNPMWRQQTQGSFSLVFNAMLHFEHLGVGRTP